MHQDNSHPQYFILENMSKNRGHADEIKGKDVIQDIVMEMKQFLNEGK